MRPRAFASGAAFRAWLEANHDRVSELVVRCYKVKARQRGMTYTEALDEALCFGWIDGVRRGVDDHSFSVRFTPRKPKSYWSAVNRRRAEELEAAGRLHPAGLLAFRAAAASGGRYSFENRPVGLSPGYQRELRANAKAWAFFRSQPPWYRRTSAFWVMSAKREETRRRRLAQLIACSEGQRRIGPLGGPRTGTPGD